MTRRALATTEALLSALLLALPCAGCLCPTPPSPTRWLAVGFRSPQQAFGSFQTALAADAPALEYAALSREFREQTFGRTLYETAREQFLDENPFVVLLADATILSQTYPSEGEAEIVALVDTMFVDRAVRIFLVRELRYWLYHTDGSLIWEGEGSRTGNLLSNQDASGNPLVYGAVRMDVEDWAPVLGYTPSTGDVGEVRVATQWKIAGFEMLEEIPENEVSPTPAP